MAPTHIPHRDPLATVATLLVVILGPAVDVVNSRFIIVCIRARLDQDYLRSDNGSQSVATAGKPCLDQRGVLPTRHVALAVVIHSWNCGML